MEHMLNQYRLSRLKVLHLNKVPHTIESTGQDAVIPLLCAAPHFSSFTSAKTLGTKPKEKKCLVSWEKQKENRKNISNKITCRQSGEAKVFWGTLPEYYPQD